MGDDAVDDILMLALLALLLLAALGLGRFCERLLRRGASR